MIKLSPLKTENRKEEKMPNQKIFIGVSSIIAIIFIVLDWVARDSSNPKFKLISADLRFIGWIIIVLNLILIIMSWLKGRFH